MKEAKALICIGLTLALATFAFRYFTKTVIPIAYESAGILTSLFDEVSAILSTGRPTPEFDAKIIQQKAEDMEAKLIRDTEETFLGFDISDVAFDTQGEIKLTEKDFTDTCMSAVGYLMDKCLRLVSTDTVSGQ